MIILMRRKIYKMILILKIKLKKVIKNRKKKYRPLK
jgi:hypothetical protein